MKSYKAISKRSTWFTTEITFFKWKTYKFYPAHIIIVQYITTLQSTRCLFGDMPEFIVTVSNLVNMVNADQTSSFKCSSVCWVQKFTSAPKNWVHSDSTLFCYWKFSFWTSFQPLSPSSTCSSGSSNSTAAAFCVNDDKTGQLTLTTSTAKGFSKIKIRFLQKE